MNRTLKIEHHICRANLGNSDDEYAAQYVEALAVALTAEYPGAEIEVNLNSDFANTSQTFVSGARCTGQWEDEQAIMENVRVIANLVWSRM